MIGISISSLLDVLLLLFFIYFSSYSSFQIGDFVNSDNFVKKAIKKSWLSAKKAFFLRKGVSDPDDIMSYKFYLEQFLNAKNELNKDLKELSLKNNEINLRTSYKKVYFGLRMCDYEYSSEMRLLIHFILELMVFSMSLIVEEKMRLINFVQNDRTNLFAAKIIIILETGYF